MTANNDHSDKNKEQPILTIIQDIKDGRIAPDVIDKDLRQRCVEVFMAEGYSVSSMAQLFNKTEKTIKRDIEAILDEKKVGPSMELAKRIVGEIIAYGHIHRDHLMRLARTKDASVAEKSQAEYLAARVGFELISRMQSLGYLPSKPTAVVGDVFHHFNGNDMAGLLDEISRQVIDVEKIASGSGVIPKEIEGDLSEVKGFIKKAESLKNNKEGEE